MSFDEIEERHDLMEALEYEEWWEASKARAKKPCPACGMPIDSEALCCDDCWEET